MRQLAYPGHRERTSFVEKIRQENNINLPNALTILRLLLLPVFAWQYLGGNIMASLGIYLVVQASDLLDGFLARRWNQITSFGKLMDPLADKLMLLTALICFGIEKQVSWSVIALVLGKELLMIVGGVYALRKKIVVSALWIGKIATGLFAAAVVAILINNTTQALGVLPEVLLYAAVAVTLAAFSVYVRNLQKELRLQKEAAGQK